MGQVEVGRLPRTGQGRPGAPDALRVLSGDTPGLTSGVEREKCLIRVNMRIVFRELS